MKISKLNKNAVTYCSSRKGYKLHFSAGFKGTVSRNGFGFWWHVCLVLGFSRGRRHFVNFLGCSNIFITQKVVLAVNANLRWLTNDSVGYLVHISFLLIGQQGLGHFFMYRPLLLIGWRTWQIVPRQRQNEIQRQPLFEQYKQQANPQLYSTFV